MGGQPLFLRPGEPYRSPALRSMARLPWLPAPATRDSAAMAAPPGWHASRRHPAWLSILPATSTSPTMGTAASEESASMAPYRQWRATVWRASAATAAQPSPPESRSRMVSPSIRLGNIYIADTANHRIRKVTADGVIQTIAGSGNYGVTGDGGPASQALLINPRSLAIDLDGSLLIADSAAGGSQTNRGRGPVCGRGQIRARPESPWNMAA